jgi:enoyl-CoA hydratase/carnithine racemase
MPAFSQYAHQYPALALERDEQGILQATLRSGTEPFRATRESRRQLANAWLAIANDPDNRVLILTGTGEDFSRGIDPASDTAPLAPAGMLEEAAEAERLLTNFLEIGIPVIAAVNGPARAHAELALLGHIVLLSDTALFQEPALRRGLPPTDGGHIVWMEVLGFVRGKHFLLTGEELPAREALRLGAANEVVPAATLLDRAYEHARALAKWPAITLRNTHEVLTQWMRRRLHEDLGYGLALRSLAWLDHQSPQLTGAGMNANGISRLASYAAKYSWLHLERDADGILLVRVHTNGGPLSWGGDSFAAHEPFADIAADPNNKVIIITGTGEAFCNQPTLTDILPYFTELTPAAMDVFFRNGPRSLDKQFQLPVPVILAVNGPATVHEEFFMSADLVIAAEEATFQDGNHVASGFSVAGTPSFWEEYLRPVRAKYFLLTGQTLSARQALEVGVAGEVVPRSQLMDRAYAHARALAKLPPAALGATRKALNQRLKRYTLDEVRMTGALFSISNLDMGGPLAEHTHPV